MQYADINGTLPPGTLYGYARRSFQLDAPVRSMLRLAARHYAKLWVNGVYVGQTYVRTHPEEWRLQVFDLTPHLRAGRNVVAFLLHGWGPPEKRIDGVPDPLPIGFVCEGQAGPCDFADLAAWRVAPAVEYLPAPRIGALLGHEEHRDLRLEPAGWREPGFDDGAWQPVRVAELPSAARVLPQPLRALREDRVFPRRVVKQGALLPGLAVKGDAPLRGPCYWQMQFHLDQPAELAMLLWNGLPLQDMVHLWYHPQPASAPLWVDGRRLDNRFAYLIGTRHEPIRLQLEAGAHAIVRPYEGGEWSSGWFGPAPVRDVTLGWSQSSDGPFAPGAVQPDHDFRCILDRLGPLSGAPCRLEEEGRLHWRIDHADASAVFEFERNMTLLVRLEIADASPGTEVEIVFGERLSDRAELVIPAAYGDRVILRGGPQVYETAFQYKSAQIVILNVRAGQGFVEFGRLSAVYRRYDHDLAGTWHGPDDVLNRVWDICRNTMEFGSQDNIMDGPWREQLLYMGDNYVHNQAAYHLFGNLELVEWQHTLYATGQMPDGIIYPNQPYRPSDPSEYRLLDQSVLWPIQLAQHWLYTGRREFIVDLLPAMVRLLDGFQNSYGRLKAEGDPRLRKLPKWVWIDHHGLRDGEPLTVRNEGLSTGMNLLYLCALHSAVGLLREFGRGDDARRLEALARTLAERLRREHWDPERSLFTDCVVDGKRAVDASLHVNLLAIEAGLADEPGRLLARTWKAPGVLQPCGPHFRIHLHAVLHQLGRFDDLLGDIRELWGQYVADGLNSLPEYIAYGGEWGCSVGHPYGASPSVHLVKSIAGLYPTAAGWREMTFDPHLCDLPFLDVTVPTPCGLVRANLRATSDGLTGQLHVPSGIRVHVPNPAVHISPSPACSEKPGLYILEAAGPMTGIVS